MATAYFAANYSNPPMYSNPQAGVSMCREFSYLASVALVINDTIALCPIPANVVVEDWYLDFPDLDTGATLAFQLGDATTAARFLAANTVGQAGGKLYGIKDGPAASLPSQQGATAAVLILKVSTAPAGGGTNTVSIRGFMRYHYASASFPSTTT